MGSKNILSVYVGSGFSDSNVNAIKVVENSGI
jgi:hypothetical protein